MGTKELNEHSLMEDIIAYHIEQYNDDANKRRLTLSPSSRARAILAEIRHRIKEVIR